MKNTATVSAIAMLFTIASVSCEPKTTSDETIQQDSIDGNIRENDTFPPHGSDTTTAYPPDSASSGTGTHNNDSSGSKTGNRPQ